MFMRPRLPLTEPRLNLRQMGALWENPEAKTNIDLYNFTLPNPLPMSQLARVVGYVS